MRLLLAEDDATLARQLRRALEAAGFTVDHAADGAEAAHLGAEERYAACILDLGLPERDGISVLSGWRKAGVAMPVLILTAREAFADKVAGFRAGADDYLTKPFRMEEVVLRLRALTRRAAGHASPVLACGPLAHDTVAGSFTLDGLPLRLTAFEARILAHLLHHAGRVVSRTELSEQLYGADSDRDFNTIEVLVSRLRRKIAPCVIETLRGEGWRLSPRMIRSLRARLLLLAAATILLALAAAWFAIARVVEGAVSRGFEARLEASLDTLAATLEREEETSALRLSALPPDPRFEQPFSGWYWQVADAEGTVRLVSASLWNTTIEERAAGEDLVTRQRRLTIPGGGEPVTLTLAAPEAALAEELAAVRRPVLVVVLVLGFALTAASILQLIIGLRPLAALRHDIAAIRAGRAARLPPPRFAEVAALTEDANALLAQNEAMVERGRRLAGDLAHGLKTPLAALRNLAAELGRDPDGEIAAAVARMEALLQRHLQRARVAGGAGLPGLRCPVGPVLEDLLFLMRRAHAARDLDLHAEAAAPDFAGRREHLEEMVGNLLDTACKWAAARVVVTARAEAGRLLIRIADDGPGLGEADRAAALRHGVRLDETKPGQGFGLAIVAETAALCGGSLTLADGGPGLVAELDLPAAGRSPKASGAQG